MLFILVQLYFTYSSATKAENGTGWPREISIGLINSYSHSILYKLVANETVHEYKLQGTIPKDVSFKFHENYGCDDLSSVTAAFDAWFNHNVSAIFGPECSEGMLAVALQASSLNKPLFGYMSILSDLANKTKYSTLVRLSYTMAYMAEAIKTVVVHHNWTSLAVIRHVRGSCAVFLSGIAQQFKQNGITISIDLEVDFKSNASMSVALMTIKTSARTDAINFLNAAYQEDMMTSDYVYITPYYYKAMLKPWEPWLSRNVSNSVKDNMLAIYKNSIVTYGETTTLFKQFQQKIKNTIDSDPATFAVANYDNDINLLELAPFHDSLSLYLKILNYSVMAGREINLSGKVVLNASSYYDFPGTTGRIVLNKFGERISNYYVMKMNKDGNFVPYLLLGADEIHRDSLQILERYEEPIWNTIDNKVPTTIPACGYRDEFCQNYTISATAMAVCIPLAGLFVISIIIVIICIQKKKAFERKLLQSTWKIDLNRLHGCPRQNTRSSFASYTGTHNTEGDTKENTKTEGKFGERGYYENALVVIKRWNQIGPIIVHHRELLLHLKTLKEMNHENINTFIGLSFNDGPFVMCLWAYCSKRSLHDIVFNEDIHLDDTFQVSIMRDIITGLEHIHTSSIGYHGRMFLSNCLVDTRWLVKLTDFGMQPILNDMAAQKAVELKDEDDMEKLLCSAPEYLRFQQQANLKYVDIYQFGMIMYQVLFRELPFTDFPVSAEDIVDGIKLGTNSGVPLRPKIKAAKELDIKLQHLLPLCWQETPSSRPSVHEMKRELNTCTKSYGRNLMDHVMAMLEKYATNLEKVVDERTTQLQEERRKADRLLYQMLPKSVADALKSGQPVNPETFDCVTIYFSDIVGFTTICSKSNPFEVVAMLNGLYSRFDEVILNVDAYKVETIGDAYLVVSGLPIRNGNEHVINIANMALQILVTLKKYRIPHMPNTAIQIRIGIHSGPVAGGVVGLTMPKYCLFGDTVNFASRMESSGEAGRIHITENTKIMLSSYPEYVTIERGQIDIKGKGICTTHWLLHKF